MRHPLSPYSTANRDHDNRGAPEESPAVRLARPREAPGRVTIGDPHPASRFGIRLALERAGFLVVAECATAGEAAARGAALRPDVCLIDVDIPGGGIVAARAISRDAPDTAIVMLSATVDEDDVVAAIVAGACGYLPKTIAPERLGAVLRGVLAGEAAIPRALLTLVVQELRRRGNGATPPMLKSVPGLTPRESQVTQLMRRGMSTREIAARLGISEVTVRRHVSAALRKLEVPDRQSAVRLFQRDASRRKPLC